MVPAGINLSVDCNKYFTTYWNHTVSHRFLQSTFRSLLQFGQQHSCDLFHCKQSLFIQVPHLKQSIGILWSIISTLLSRCAIWTLLVMLSIETHLTPGSRHKQFPINWFVLTTTNLEQFRSVFFCGKLNTSVIPRDYSQWYSVSVACFFNLKNNNKKAHYT